MKLQRPPFFVLLVAALSLGLASCSKSGEDKDQNSREFDEANEELKHQIEEVAPEEMQRRFEAMFE